MSQTIHDNILVGYSVQCEERRIILQAEYRYAAPVERTDVCFEGVEAYLLMNDVFGTILFGIEELPVGDLVRRERAYIEQGRQWGWPGGWTGSLEEEIARLTRSGIRAWEISSSIGLTGWVLARDMTLIAMPPIG